MKKRFWQAALALGIGMMVIGMVVGILPTQAQDVPTSSHTPTPTEIIDEIFLRQIENTESQVCALRQVIQCLPPQRDLMTREEMAIFLEENWQVVYPPEQAQQDILFYSVFGFMPLETPLWNLTQQVVLETPPATFYDEERNMLVVYNTSELRPYDELLYTYAYSQFLSANRFPREISANRDERMTLAALRQGESQWMVAHYTQWLLATYPETAKALMEKAAYPFVNTVEIPSILNAENTFKSEQGLNFVRYIWQLGGWEQVDLLYDYPPLSTEHILHPDRYLFDDPDVPKPITLYPIHDVLKADDSSWYWVYEDVMGEFYLRQHLALQLPFDEVDIAASGWGGDRFLLYTRGSDQAIALVWRLRWDSDEDVRQFDELYEIFLGFYFQELTPFQQRFAEGIVSCWEAETESRAACLYSTASENLVVFAPTRILALALLRSQIVLPILG